MQCSRWGVAAVGACLQSLEATQVAARAVPCSPAVFRAADFPFSESCICPGYRCTDWALLPPRGEHMWCFRIAISRGWPCWSLKLLKDAFEGGGLFSHRCCLFAAALTAWTSQSCPYRAVSGCSYLQSSACCWSCRMTTMPTWSLRSATAATSSSFCR